MIWVKMLHILGVASWMAAVFYLPRLLVNLAEAHQAGESTTRLEGMAFRLFRFGIILAGFALACGLWLWLVDGVDGRWLHWKLGFVLLLIFYYLYCGAFVLQMRRGVYRKSGTFFRILNEGALIIVVPILIFAVVKIG